jgi:hypothetical protein
MTPSCWYPSLTNLVDVVVDVVVANFFFDPLKKCSFSIPNTCVFFSDGPFCKTTSLGLTQAKSPYKTNHQSKTKKNTERT